MSRSRLLLLLFVLLGLALTYAWFETPRQQRVKNPAESVVGDSAVSTEGEGSSVPVVTGLDFTSGEDLSFQKPRRDLFRPLYSEPDPIKSSKVVAPPPVPEPVMVMPPPVMTRPAALPKFGTKPIPPLKVLGYLQKGSSQSAFLSSVQGEVYVVKQGERFADGLLVRSLDADKIHISRDLKDEGVTLYFSKENARLKAAGPLVSDRPIFTPVEMPQIETLNPQLPLQQDQPPSIDGVKTVDP